MRTTKQGIEFGYQMWEQFAVVEGFPREDTKQCVRCEKIKPVSEFPNHIQHKDRKDSRCRACKKKEQKLVKNLRKTAPGKPEDGKCQCCGEIVPPDKWRLDHDGKTGKFRGWICDGCNTGLGKLGDNVAGLLKALSYLQKRE